MTDRTHEGPVARTSENVERFCRKATASTDPKWAEELCKLADAIERGDYD